MQFDDNNTCESAVKICGVQSISQVLDKQFTRPEEESEEEGEAEVAEDTVTFLDALKALQVATQYMCQLIQMAVLLKCATNFKINYTDRELEKRRKHMQHLMTGLINK